MRYNLPEGWKVVRLGEVFEYRSGLSKGRKYFGTGYPYLSFKEIFNNYFVPEQLLELVESSENERKNMSIEKGDIFLTRTSETFYELGMSSVALKDYRDSTFNGFTKRLRPKIKKNLYPKYSGYYFRSKIFRNQVDSIATMTTRASLNNSMLDIMNIIIPPYIEQKAIANILSTLDDKIENNNKINKTLEEIAQQLFKHWFVDFEFPNENGEPYRSSGGEMVESELGMIPKGWKVGNLGNYTRVRSGFAFKSSWWKDGGVPVIKIKNLQNNTVNFNDIGYVDINKIDKAKDFIVTGGDLLIAMTGATIGKLGLVPESNDTILVNQRVGKFFLGEKPIEKISFLYCLLTQDCIYEEIVSRGDGSAQPNISPSAIESIKIIMPESNIINKFNSINKFSFKEIIKNQLQNQELSNLRDTLLPKLMSGEIRVPLEEEEDSI